MNWEFVDEFIEALLRLKTHKEARDFLMGILTPKELQEIPTRLQIVKMLKRRLPQYRIAEKLKVGIGTITRGSNEIKKGRFKQVK